MEAMDGSFNVADMNKSPSVNSTESTTTLPPINHLFSQCKAKRKKSKGLPATSAGQKEAVISDNVTELETAERLEAVQAILELSTPCDVQDDEAVIDHGPCSVANVIDPCDGTLYASPLVTDEGSCNTSIIRNDVILADSPGKRTTVTVIGDNSVVPGEIYEENRPSQAVVVASVPFDESELMSSPTVYSLLQNPETCILDQLENSTGQVSEAVIYINSPRKQKLFTAKRSDTEVYLESNSNCPFNVKLLPTDERRDETMTLVVNADLATQSQSNNLHLMGGRCSCPDVENREQVSVDQLFVTDGQMLRIWYVEVYTIGGLEFYAFERDDRRYIPLALVYKHAGLSVKEIIRNGLESQPLHLGNLDPAECEFLKQKCDLRYHTAATNLIDLSDLRRLCRKLFMIHSSAILETLAKAPVLVKRSGAEMKCIDCGCTTRDASECIYQELTDHSVSEVVDNPANDILTTIGTVLVNGVLFNAFKIDTKLYMCVKDLIKQKIFTLPWLKNKLMKFKRSPIKAPAEVENYLELNDSNAQNTLWLDIFQVGCLCFTEKIHFHGRRLDLATSLSNECYQYIPQTILTIDKPVQSSSCAIDSLSLEIVTDCDADAGNKSSHSFKIHYPSRGSGRKSSTKKGASGDCTCKSKDDLEYTQPQGTFSAYKLQIEKECTSESVPVLTGTVLVPNDVKCLQSKTFMTRKSKACRSMHKSTVGNMSLTLRKETTEATNNLISLAWKGMNNETVLRENSVDEGYLSPVQENTVMNQSTEERLCESGNNSRICAVPGSSDSVVQNEINYKNSERSAQLILQMGNCSTGASDGKFTKFGNVRKTPGDYIVVDSSAIIVPQLEMSEEFSDADKLIVSKSVGKDQCEKIIFDEETNCKHQEENSNNETRSKDVLKVNAVGGPGEYIVYDKLTNFDSQGKPPGEYILVDSGAKLNSVGENTKLQVESDIQSKPIVQNSSMNDDTASRQQTQYASIGVVEGPGEYIIHDKLTNFDSQGKSPGEYIVVDSRPKLDSVGKNTELQVVSNIQSIPIVQNSSANDHTTSRKQMHCPSQKSSIGLTSPEKQASLSRKFSKHCVDTRLTPNKMENIHPETLFGMDRKGQCDSQNEYSSKGMNVGENHQSDDATTLEENISKNPVCKSNAGKQRRQTKDRSSDNGSSQSAQLYESETVAASASDVQKMPNIKFNFGCKRKSSSPRKLRRPRHKECLAEKNEATDKSLSVELPYTQNLDNEPVVNSCCVQSDGVMQCDNIASVTLEASTFDKEPKVISPTVGAQSYSLLSTINKLKNSLAGKYGQDGEFSGEQLNSTNTTNTVEGQQAKGSFAMEAKHESVPSDSNCMSNPQGEVSKKVTLHYTSHLNRHSMNDVSPMTESQLMVNREINMHSDTGKSSADRPNVDEKCNDTEPVSAIKYEGRYDIESGNTDQRPLSQNGEFEVSDVRKRKRGGSEEDLGLNKQRKVVSPTEDGRQINVVAYNSDEAVRSAIRQDMEEKLKTHVMFSLRYDPVPHFTAVGFKAGAEEVFPALFGKDRDCPSAVRLREKFLGIAARHMNNKFLNIIKNEDTYQ